MNRPNASPERLYGIQGLRGFAVLMVLSVHLYEVEMKYSHGPLWLGRWIHFNISGVDLFLVISGFVLTHLAFGHFAEPGHVKSYAFNRITRVYPVYLLYTLPLIPVYLWRPTLFNATEGHSVDLVRSALLLPDVNLPLIPVAWTLHHELYFYIVLGFMLSLREALLPRAMLAWTVVTTALVAWGATIPREAHGAFEKVLFNPINYEFILGMGAAWLVHRGVHRWARSCLALGIAWMLAGYVAYYLVTGNDWPGVFERIAMFGVPATLICYGIVVVEQRRRWVFAPFLVWVGDAAYSIYLSHVMSVVLVGRVWHAIGVSGWFAHLLFLASATAFGLWVGWLAYNHIEKPLLKFFRTYDPARRRAARPAAS